MLPQLQSLRVLITSLCCRYGTSWKAILAEHTLVLGRRTNVSDMTIGHLVTLLCTRVQRQVRMQARYVGNIRGIRTSMHAQSER